MAISWNAHGSVKIRLLEHFYLDEFARDENMTRLRNIYLLGGGLGRCEICADNRTRVNATNYSKTAEGDLHRGFGDNFRR